MDKNLSVFIIGKSEVSRMKKKTYNNVLKAARLIRKKGYEEKESLEMAVQVFDNMEMLKNGMSAEWFIEKIAPKNQLA